MTPPDSLAERKARLVAQSDLQRMQAMLAWHTARSIMSPPAAGERSGMSRSIATTLIGIALPLIGARKLRGTMRVLTVAATALRLFRAWRAR
jgi:hypothetical protein